MGSDGSGNSLGGLLAGAAAGGLFLLFWLVLGVPLVGSAVAGVAAYAGVWFMLRGLPSGKQEKPLDLNFVDKDLARKTVVEGTALLGEFREAWGKFSRGSAFLPSLKKLDELMAAVIRDVEQDPKDAPAAGAFLRFQGQTALRITKMAFDLETRPAAGVQTSELRERIEKLLEKLLRAFSQHLAHLQQDNVNELQAELEVLESSLGLESDFDQELEKAAQAVKPKPSVR